MRFTSSIFATCMALGGLILSSATFATNGYFPHGTGAKNKAMAGAGMAMPEDAISIVNNPAVAVFLDDKMDVGVSAFMPRRNYSTFFGGNNGRNNTFTFGNVNIDSDDDLFILPEIARTTRLQNESAFAWAFYMRTGIGTSYRGGSATFDPDADGPLGVSTFPGTYGDGNTRFELSQALVDITWAKKLGDKASFGVSAVLAAQSLEVEGMGGFARYTQTFAASNGAIMPEKLSGNDRDINYGAGLKVGFHSLLGKYFSLGAMYQTEINIGSSGEYADLLTDGGDLDIPAWLRIGLTWRPIKHFSFSVDMQRIWYGDIDALGNSFRNIWDCPTTGWGGTALDRCLGGKNGAGFGWRNVPVYSFGGSWSVNADWTLRAGMSIADQPVVYYENTFNIPVINLTEAHYTAGISRRQTNGHEWTLSLMYSEEESLETLNQLDPSQIIRMTTDQFDIQLTYSWGH